jgi:hypothetical protein
VVSASKISLKLQNEPAPKTTVQLAFMTGHGVVRVVCVMMQARHTCFPGSYVAINAALNSSACGGHVDKEAAAVVHCMQRAQGSLVIKVPLLVQRLLRNNDAACEDDL